MKVQDLDQIINSVLSKALKQAKSGKNAHRNVNIRMLKIVEEVGELAEAIAHKQGFLPHKTMKEPPEGEVADVIITALDTLVALYPDLSLNKVRTMLAEQLVKKSTKWQTVLDQVTPAQPKRKTRRAVPAHM